MRVLSILLGFWLLPSTGTYSTLPAQNSPLPNAFDETRLSQDLARAEAFLTSFKNDSAAIIIAQIISALEEQGQLDMPFGIRVQLAEATALEQDQQDELAVQKLLQARELSQEKQQWDVFAKACLVLANLYEKIGREKSCLEQLRLAQSSIETHQLDSIYPSFAVRISSYHRIFGDRDSSLFYAREVLRTAPKFNLLLEEAVGHLLMSMLTRDSSADVVLAHYEPALKLYQQLEDYTGCSFTFSGIASLYYRNNQLLRALAYNDSVIAYASKAIALGHEKHPTIANAYLFRGAVFRALGQPDSAWHYLDKGYNMELAFIRSSTDKKVIEIDARYNDEKKARQIEKQARQIQFERDRRNWFLASALIAILFAALLASLYLRLRIANRETRKQAEQLKSLDATKSLFFANVSHELRTPLTLVLGPIHSLLKDTQLNEKQSRLLQMASQSGQQLQQLVNEILDLRKLEMGKMALDEEPTRLAAFFRNYFAQFESLAHRKQVDYSYDIRVGEEIVANIDREKNRQILYNLLSNAFKFTPAGGRIEASLSLSVGILQLEIADSGPGIHPDDLPHVFDRFFQAGRPDKPAEGGTGIGLALCREHTRLFGGEIEIESSLGQGAISRLAFPVTIVPDSAHSLPDSKGGGNAQHRASHLAHPKITPPLKAGGAPKPTILVVEDNPDLQDYLRLILSGKYQVLIAENGQTALDCLLRTVDCKLSTAKCQLILSDLMMPVMDGYQLLGRLKAEDATRHLPVIMLTARADVRDKLKALRLGVDDYLLKPFDEEELLVRIENLLKNQLVRRREAALETDEGVPAISKQDQEWLEAFEAYVRKNLSNDMLNIPSLAQDFAVSESTLLRQLKRLTGLSPAKYLQEMRLDQARHLLEARFYRSIAKVAAEVGYNDVRSFSRSFKNRFGKLPSEFLSG